MNAVIIDDDKVAIKALQDRLKKFPDFTVVGTATTGKAGLECLAKKRPDLIFLDIEMPDMSGITFLEQMKASSNNCCVVIYSSYEDYMLEAFRKDAFDYLHKPIDDEELDTVLDHVFEHRDDLTAPPANSENAKDPMVLSNEKFLFYTNAVDFRVVHIKDIGLFVYNRTRRMWEVVVAGKKDYIPLKRSVTCNMIMELDPHFLQVHQSYIINLNYLIEVVDNTCHFYPPFDKITDVHVGRFFRHKLIEKFSSL
jgi:two-component system, LytTR family, response regulator